MKKKLIITAHDYGLCRSVNEGIEYVLEHKNNVITELSLLPNAPGSMEAAKYIRRKGLSASLCINLTTFKPLLKSAKSLVGKDGEFLPVKIPSWDFSSLDKFEDHEVKEEVQAQWDWFCENVGEKPNAILSRKNETGDPKILIPVVELAKRGGVPIRSPFWKWKANYGAQSYVDQLGVKQTDYVFVGLKNWGGKFGYNLEEDIELLVEDSDLVSGISELIVLPGFVDEELFKLSSLSWQRGQFVQLTKTGSVPKAIKSLFELIGYRDLQSPTQSKKPQYLLKNITFRLGNPDNIKEMVYINQNDGFIHAYPLPTERLENLFSRGESFIVAREGKKVVGFGSIDCEIRARIHFLSVLKDYSGLGIGSKIMQTMLELAKSKGYKKVHTIVESKSTKEIFLKKIGFSKVGFYKDRYASGKDASVWEILLD